MILPSIGRVVVLLQLLVTAIASAHSLVASGTQTASVEHALVHSHDLANRALAARLLAVTVGAVAANVDVAGTTTTTASSITSAPTTTSTGVTSTASSDTATDTGTSSTTAPTSTVSQAAQQRRRRMMEPSRRAWWRIGGNQRGEEAMMDVDVEEGGVKGGTQRATTGCCPLVDNEGYALLQQRSDAKAGTLRCVYEGTAVSQTTATCVFSLTTFAQVPRDPTTPIACPRHPDVCFDDYARDHTRSGIPKSGRIKMATGSSADDTKLARKKGFWKKGRKS